MDTERVLITGATGFIGYALARRFVADGAQVTALVREKVGRGLGEGLPAGVEVVEVDLRYAGGVKRAVDSVSPTLVLHLAAVGVTDPFLPVAEAVRGNVETTINVLRAVRGCCRVLTARTPGEIECLNPYSASKAAAWQFCKMYQRTEGWPIVGVMPFQAYGPGQPARMVLGAALKAARAGESFPTTSGEQLRDWICIDDVVDGILASARAENVEGESIELGTGIGTPVRDIVLRLFECVGKGQPLIGALPQRPGETPEQIADAERTERLIGWRAKIGIEAGLKKMIEHDLHE